MLGHGWRASCRSETHLPCSKSASASQLALSRRGWNPLLLSPRGLSERLCLPFRVVPALPQAGTEHPALVSQAFTCPNHVSAKLGQVAAADVGQLHALEI